jgi:UDP-N-acetylglucosamine/UDP-N-acetylgalactosamine 4-epimerase
MIDNELKERIGTQEEVWVITGVAGFIGSNLAETLLGLGQVVRGIDDFSNGKKENLEAVRIAVGDSAWKNFSFFEGDIADAGICREACKKADYVLHQAAAVSVPRSFKEPVLCLRTNILGFLNILLAARDVSVKKFVYASSSSIYGDNAALPKTEENIGKPLSPYALSKFSDEALAGFLTSDGEMGTVGLRYFNVFGRRQNPNGDYAAVIPKFIKCLHGLQSPVIYGDGETTRDFCYIDNVVEANLLAALSNNRTTAGQAFNIAVGDKTSLNELFHMLRDSVARATNNAAILKIEPKYETFRPGDIRHSIADISKAKKMLGYSPKVRVKEGLERLVSSMIIDHHIIK